MKYSNSFFSLNRPSEMSERTENVIATFMTGTIFVASIVGLVYFVSELTKEFQLGIVVGMALCVLYIICIFLFVFIIVCSKVEDKRAAKKAQEKEE